jgi:hypothetical protein
MTVTWAVSEPRRPIFIVSQSFSVEVGSPTRQTDMASPSALIQSRQRHGAVRRVPLLVPGDGEADRPVRRQARGSRPRPPPRRPRRPTSCRPRPPPQSRPSWISPRRDRRASARVARRHHVGVPVEAEAALRAPGPRPARKGW